MKKPKKLKLPKKPKKTASLEALKNYLTKCKEVHRENKKRELEFKKHTKLYTKIKGLY
jgi:hypothetical protein